MPILAGWAEGLRPHQRVSHGAGLAIRSPHRAGIIALNRTLDAMAARVIIEMFTEVIIAPGRQRRGPSPSSPPRRTCGYCWRAACPDPRTVGLTAKKPSPAVCLVQSRDKTPWSMT